MKVVLFLCLLVCPGILSALDFRKIKNVDYIGDGNPRQMLDLYLPKKEGPQKHPVIVWVHGGAWKMGSKDRAGLALKAMKYVPCAVVSINYRLTQESKWPAQIHDCQAALRWVKGNAKKYQLDPDRIVVWGASAGGQLVSMLGATQDHQELDGKLGPHLEQSTKVKAVVNFFGPADFVLMNSQGSSMNHNRADSPEGLLLGGEVSKLPMLAKQASPFHQATKDGAPILTVHGTQDPLVPYLQGQALDRKLDELKVPSILLTVEGAGHGKGFGPSVEKSVVNFLKHHLLGEKLDLMDSKVKAGE